MRIKELFQKHDVSVAWPRYPYVIAEAGVNHEGSMAIAKRLIDETKQGGKVKNV